MNKPVLWLSAQKKAMHFWHVKWLTKVAWTIKVAAALGRRRAGCVCSSSPLHKCQLQSPSLQPLVWNGARLVGVLISVSKECVCGEVGRVRVFMCYDDGLSCQKRAPPAGFRCIYNHSNSPFVCNCTLFSFFTIPLRRVCSLYMWLRDSDWVNETRY